MALIECPECSQDISDQASVCPRCGYPFDTNRVVSQSPSTASVVDAAPRKLRSRSTGHLVGTILNGILGSALIFFAAGPATLIAGLIFLSIAVWLFVKWMKAPLDDFNRELSLAADPDTNPGLLDEMGHSLFDAVKMQVVLNPNTSVSTLQKLSAYDDPEISREAEDRLTARGTNE